MSRWISAIFPNKRSQRFTVSTHPVLMFAVLISTLVSAVDVSPAAAATTLTVEPITWNVIGLDSNLPAVGPNHFPVGVRVCNTGTETAYIVAASLVWDSSNDYIDIRPGTNSTLSVPSLAVGACTDFYFEVEVDRDSNAYDTTREYHIEISADAGATTASTPMPRELYVEHLISQSRNNTLNMELSTTGAVGSYTSVGAGETMILVVGGTYWIKLDASTATNGYEQIESFINFPNTIFQVLSVDTTYAVESSTNMDPPYDTMYGDGCIWESNPKSPNYRTCMSTGKAGGDVTVTYQVKILSVPTNPLENPEVLHSLIYDFSGSSYHYNSDMGAEGRYVNILDPSAIPITKSFTPDAVIPPGTSTLAIRITNPGTTSISGVNFTDPLPTSMTVATTPNASTIGCGTPTFSPTAGDTSLSFSYGTIAWGATCIVKVDVYVPLAGSYPNTTNHLFVEGTTPGTGTDTGNSASATLTAAANVVACSNGTMAQWTVPPTTANPPDTTGGLPTTKAANVSTATASARIPASTAIQTNTGVAPDTYSWDTHGYKNDGQYVDFTVQTKNYSGVGLSFYVQNQSPANGPTSMTLSYSTDGVNFTTLSTLVTPSTTSWTLFGPFDFSGLTSTTGNSIFRISAAGAKNDNGGAGLNFDMITFSGCSYYPPPTLNKSFATDPIIVSSGVSLLTFNVGNNQTTPYNSVNLTGVTFTDPLPAGLEIVNDLSYPASTTCTDGTLTAVNGTTAISLSGVSMTADSTCTVSVYVRGAAPGVYDNVSGYIDSTESEPNKTSSGYGQDDIKVIAPPVIVKYFGAVSILTGSTTSLTFKITNPNITTTLSGVQFTDALPAGLVIATPNGLSGSCGGGTITAAAGSSSVGLSSASLAPSESCTFSMDVLGTAVGTQTNSVTVSSTNAGTGNTSTADLIVEAPTPSLSLMKQVGPSASGPWYSSLIIPAGSSVYYQFIVENTGDVPLTSINITDLDVNTSGCTLTDPLPFAVAANENHITTCVVGPVLTVAGVQPNTATAHGTYNSTEYDSAPDTAVYENGNFGHLPAAYDGMNLYNAGGAFHINGDTYFGFSVTTTDLDGINTVEYTPKATDDGVTWTPNVVWVAGADGGSTDVSVQCGSTQCYMNAWMDWNNDRNFDDPGEQIFMNVMVNDGTATLTFDIPAGTVLDGTFYSRFRVYDQLPIDPQPDRKAHDGKTPLAGEIEDPFFTLNGGVVNPVTLSYFLAERQGRNVQFTWSTVTETGNLGFNLYVEKDGKPLLVNAEMIPSRVIDSLERQDYTFRTDVAGDVFYVDDVDVSGDTRRHGPFNLGEVYGERAQTGQVDWAAIREENAVRVDPLKPGLVSAAGGVTSLDLKVNRTGLYRVTYEMLRDSGLDLAGVAPSKIQLTSRGQKVPFYVQSGLKFGAGAYIEFHGQALDALYTDTNIYTIKVGQTLSTRIPTVNVRPLRSATPVGSYAETVEINNQRVYANTTPGSDAWYDTAMLVFKTPKTWEFPFQVNGLANPSAPATLNLSVWGMTILPQDPDHHLLVAVNGVSLADGTFDGLVEQTLKVTLPAGTLKEGTNTLQLTLPGDTGGKYDLIHLDKFSITYQRLFRSQNGRLSFTAAGSVFKVTDLPTKNVVVYRFNQKGVTRLGGVQIQAAGSTFTAAFAGTPQASTYLVTTAEAMYSPTLTTPRPLVNLNQPAEYLIISHPNFINSLEPLVQARQAQGLTVSVVDVNDLYAQYSDGIFDPRAIQRYIAHASQNLGTRYVLLVGGDTYDYRNYLGINSISFIPSLYVTTGPIAKFVPADPLYADTNADNVPDLAIGRFPVRTTAELELVINKTLAYAGKDYGGTAVFASDRIDSVEMVSFKSISNNLAALLPDHWSVENIYLDNLSVSSARDQLIAAMNRGTALVSFTGHSGPTVWTFSGLFNTQNAATLTNHGRPFVAVQWGCWNTYYVNPSKIFMVQSLLFSGDQGAVAVLGSSTLTDSVSDALLGSLLTPRMVTPGMSIGQALQEAKLELALAHPELLDVLLGWSLMGDPALVVQP